jgi:hypothetical protein
MFSRWPRLSRLFVVSGLALLLAGTDLLLSRTHRAGPVSKDAPRLLVLVVFDQMRGDYPERWRSLFGRDGLRRLTDEGAWFQNCHYPYSHTVTGAGHASFLTGTAPDHHGIVGNEWLERREGRVVNCVDSDRYTQVPPTAPARDGKRRADGSSPERLLAPTLGDVLKEATNGKSRIVSLSFKDRSAILPAGRRADACYWLDTDTGKFVTSTYYRGRLHPWVEEFNQAKPPLVDRWFGKDWDRLRSDIDYVDFSGPDDVIGEGKGYGQGITFPHPMTGGAARPGPKYYAALYNSPFGNELLLELTKRAIDAERLGTGPVPDLLCVSFSCNDPIGHCWGPDSQEVLDVTLRSDRIVAELLAHLDQRVGRGNYLLALSADHGVCPLPEVSRSQKRDAGRIGFDVLATRARNFLDETHGSAAWIDKTAGPWLYLNRDLIRQRGLNLDAVAKSLAEWLVTQPGIGAAYTQAQLVEGSFASDDTIGPRVRRSFHPDRCGDVTVIQKPYYLFTSPFATGTNHGTPYPYDTHVPLLVYGPGIAGGPRSEPVTPQAIAAIFAHFLGIEPPSAADAPVPAGLIETAAKR